jgi:hypothetical protein
MTPETTLSDLIGRIYGTALDRALWTDALTKSVEFVGGSAATLFSKNPTARDGGEAECRNGLFRGGGGFRSQGFARNAVIDGDHVEALQADAERTAVR